MYRKPPQVCNLLIDLCFPPPSHPTNIFYIHFWTFFFLVCIKFFMGHHIYKGIKCFSEKAIDFLPCFWSDWLWRNSYMLYSCPRRRSEQQSGMGNPRCVRGCSSGGRVQFCSASRIGDSHRNSWNLVKDKQNPAGYQLLFLKWLLSDDVIIQCPAATQEVKPGILPRFSSKFPPRFWSSKPSGPCFQFKVELVHWESGIFLFNFKILSIALSFSTSSSYALPAPCFPSGTDPHWYDTGSFSSTCMLSLIKFLFVWCFTNVQQCMCM